MRTDLVIDVGMHIGKDTELYISKGFQVVGIEANPELAFTWRRPQSRDQTLMACPAPKCGKGLKPFLVKRKGIAESVRSQYAPKAGLTAGPPFAKKLAPRLTNPSATAVCGVLSFSTV